MHLVYNVALFDAARVREMLAQLVGVLRQAAEDVERPVHRMSLLTEEARSVLPDPTAALSPEWRGSVPEIFAAHAVRTPDALAVADPAERWSYAELDAAATVIAHRLVADGVRPGDVVAIHGHRSAALVRALIGTLRAGAAFLVLDPAYPAARLAEYVRIARPTGWLPIAEAGEVPAELVDALRDTVRSTIPLEARNGDAGSGGVRGGGQREVVAANSFAPADADPDSAAIAAGSIAPSDFSAGDPSVPSLPEIGPDSLAYLSFTSGTTGKPKAVMGRHGSLTHFTPWLAERFAIGADDRFSLLSGLAHDPLHRDVFTPLQLGASVVAPRPGRDRHARLPRAVDARGAHYDRALDARHGPAARGRRHRRAGRDDRLAAPRLFRGRRAHAHGRGAAAPPRAQPAESSTTTAPRRRSGPWRTSSCRATRPALAKDIIPVGSRHPGRAGAHPQRGGRERGRRRGGRDVDAQPARGPRLPGRPRADGCTFRGWRLPDGRFGTLPARRRGGDRRPRGPAGEDPRLPHRAGGDRGRAARVRLRARHRRRGPR